MVLPKSTSFVVKAPDFGQIKTFGEQFTKKYQFQSFQQLGQTERIAMHKVNTFGFQYSHRCYGRKPIVEQFSPLRENVTIFLDFSTFENFGTLKWD